MLSLVVLMVSVFDRLLQIYENIEKNHKFVKIAFGPFISYRNALQETTPHCRFMPAFRGRLISPGPQVRLLYNG
jgi:hypothetical protein